MLPSGHVEAAGAEEALGCLVVGNPSLCSAVHLAGSLVLLFWEKCLSYCPTAVFSVLVPSTSLLSSLKVLQPLPSPKMRAILYIIFGNIFDVRDGRRLSSRLYLSCLLACSAVACCTRAV